MFTIFVGIIRAQISDLNDVKATRKEKEFLIDNVFVGSDRYNLPADSEFPENTDFSKSLYLLNDDTFKIMYNKQLAMLADKFNCIVSESIGVLGELKKILTKTLMKPEGIVRLTNNKKL